MWLRIPMAFALPAVLSAFTITSSAQAMPDDDAWRAVQDAFAASMYEPTFPGISANHEEGAVRSAPSEPLQP